jgi:hypothetical protein
MEARYPGSQTKRAGESGDFVPSPEAKMSKWIPWEQLAPPEALWAEAEETVRTVRDRLRDLGGRPQYNAWILIRLPDGRVAPTSAPMLRKQAQEIGVSILDQQLVDLLERLCPEPWSTESTGPEYQAAHDAATIRQLPVIGSCAGQPAGLCAGRFTL